MLEKLLDRFREKGPSRPRTKTEAERRRGLVVVLVIVVAVLTAVSLVGYGYYDTNVRPWNQRILKVNGTVIEMRAFVKMLSINGVSDSSSAPYIATMMEENELERQYLDSEFGVRIGKDAIDDKLRVMLVSENGTDEEYDTAYKNLKDTLKKYGISVKDLKKLYIEPTLVDTELRKQIGEREYPATDNYEHAQVQALLVTGADDATQLRARWEAGEDFDTLADEDSVSESLGHITVDNTTMEWVAMGTKSAAFDGYAFGEVWSSGMISDPIQDTDSTGSYWLIRVLARESRTLSESDRDTLVSAAFTKWLEDAKNSEDNVIVNYLDKKGGQAKLTWAVDHVTVSTS
jgi:hypothetical protein